MNAECGVGQGRVMYRRIMVPVDLTNPATAEKAMTVATRMALADNAELLVISVQPDTGKPLESEQDFEPLLEDYLAERRRPDLQLDGVLTVGGKVWAEVRHAARDMDVDLIVMASHEPRLSDLLLGSNAGRVALHSGCSVLVVR
jgi:nucleotide-binding universal stress UspA family protein